MSKIGVGVITMGLREIKDYRLSSVNSEFYLFKDINRVGPASGRNQCIKHLYDSGCDHIFLFDDDCYPIHDGWDDYIVSVAQNNNMNFLSLPEIFKDQFLDANSQELCYWSGSVGCFSYQSRKFIDLVGYYNTAYDRYGFEDSARNHRAVVSGIDPTHNGYPSALRVSNYIYSEDIYGDNPIVNISYEDKMEYIEKNHHIYLEEITSGQIYYPFSTK